MLQNVVCPNQTIIQWDEIVDRNIHQVVIFLVAKWFVLAIELLIQVAIFEVERLILLIKVLLEELLRNIHGAAKGEHGLDDARWLNESTVLASALSTEQ